MYVVGSSRDALAGYNRGHSGLHDGVGCWSDPDCYINRWTDRLQGKWRDKPLYERLSE